MTPSHHASAHGTARAAYVMAIVFLFASVSPLASAFDPTVVPTSEDAGVGVVSTHSHRGPPVASGSCHITNEGVLERCKAEDVSGRGSLYLGGRGITAIRAGAFDGLANLYELNIRDNYIEFLDAGVFDGLSNLEVLRLSENLLGSIERGVLGGLPAMEELYLYNNHISSLEAGDFDGLRNLKILFLQENDIAIIGPGAFAGLTSLEDLRLAYNPISEIAVMNGLSWDHDLDILRFDQTSPGMCSYVGGPTVGNGYAGEIAGEGCQIAIEGWYAGCCGIIEDGLIVPETVQCCATGGSTKGASVALAFLLSAAAAIASWVW